MISICAFILLLLFLISPALCVSLSWSLFYCLLTSLQPSIVSPMSAYTHSLFFLILRSLLWHQYTSCMHHKYFPGPFVYVIFKDTDYRCVCIYRRWSILTVLHAGCLSSCTMAPAFFLLSLCQGEGCYGCSAARNLFFLSMISWKRPFTTTKQEYTQTYMVWVRTLFKHGIAFSLILFYLLLVCNFTKGTYHIKHIIKTLQQSKGKYKYFWN